jgi:hypothetical protein
MTLRPQYTPPEDRPGPLVSIYLLVVEYDTNTWYPMYVGQTVHPRARERQHLGRRCHNQRLFLRIAEVRTYPIRPRIYLRVVETVEPALAAEREQAWLDRVLAAGWTPANIARPCAVGR